MSISGNTVGKGTRKGTINPDTADNQRKETHTSPRKRLRGTVPRKMEKKTKEKSGKPEFFEHADFYSRLDWYRRGFHGAVWAALGMMVILIFMTVSIVFLSKRNKPYAVVIAMSPNGNILTPRELTKPIFSASAVTNFATDVATGIYTTTFQTWMKDLLSLEPYFTPDAFRSLVTNMRTNILPDVVNQKLFVNASPTGAAEILNEGLIQMGPGSGSYGWIVQIPLVVTYSAGSTAGDTQHIAVTLTIVQADPLQYVKGMAVVHVDFKGMGG